MFVLLIAAIAVIALVAAVVLMITRTRARDRQDQQARQTAAAQARAAAAAQERRRRVLPDTDDELTSVIPAIRLPWATQFPAPREPGYRDLDGEYPQFSALTPFQADAAPGEPPWPAAARPGWASQPGPRDDGRPLPPPRPQPGDQGSYPAAPSAWDEHPRPVPAPDARVTPAGVPAEHAEYAAALERARRRPTHGSHRGGHARRRRG